ncbi:Rhamnogalacturonate lyase family protein [Forsythia ovata]|uniref:Rhamnogalacturonate lyase family protein n=1 Tax=Forsythia ovata TaxID=205694 RepID=A0ABD1NY82_9LAMI
MEHLEGWPDLNIDEERIAFKLNKDMFHYMAISDDRQRIMPTVHDRTIGRALEYKEAILLTYPHSPTFKHEVCINNSNAPRSDFTTKWIGMDNAIARHGIHGLYLLYSINIRGIQLVNGTNTIYLKQSRGGHLLIGVMYDYIRLEGPHLAKC